MNLPLSRRSTIVFAAAILAAAFGIWFLNSNSTNAGAGLNFDNQLQNRKVSPAGKLLTDAATGEPAVMPLTFNFVRSPDLTGTDGQGRFLIAVNSGFGLTFNSKSKPQQTLSVIDLNKSPEPQIVQDIYFPSPQSANFGLVFDKKAQTGRQI